MFCNGRRLFHHGCGYTAFTVDLTSALHLGKKNVVAVRCDSREDLNIPPFGGSIDYLTYGGIYRAVSLDIKEPAYLRDVFVEARAEGDFPHLHRHGGRDGGLHPAGRDPQPRRKPGCSTVGNLPCPSPAP